MREGEGAACWTAEAAAAVMTVPLGWASSSSWVLPLFMLGLRSIGIEKQGWIACSLTISLTRREEEVQTPKQRSGVHIEGACMWDRHLMYA